MRLLAQAPESILMIVVMDFRARAFFSRAPGMTVMAV